jgi:hypothetical protein
MSEQQSEQQQDYPERQRRKEERRLVEARFPDDAVLTIKEYAALINIHHLTLRKMISSGEGPPVVRINQRHFGIVMRAGRVWLESRTVKQK